MYQESGNEPNEDQNSETPEPAPVTPDSDQRDSGQSTQSSVTSETPQATSEPASIPSDVVELGNEKPEHIAPSTPEPTSIEPDEAIKAFTSTPEPEPIESDESVAEAAED